MDEGDTFGALLKKTRETAALTQKNLAEAAGVSINTVSGLEREVNLPLAYNLTQLANGLKLTGSERETFMALGRGEAGPPPSASHIVAPPRPASWLADRLDEIGTLTNLLEGPARLVTVTGPPGVGKSRLALEVARGAERMFPDGIAYADLADLPASGPIVPAIAAAVGLSEPGVPFPLPHLGARLRDLRLLLVLDNIDPVLEAARQIVDLLAVAPSLRVLATSREALGVTQEKRFLLAPLDLAAAAALFIERALHAVPGSGAGRPEADQPSAMAVRVICERLDRLPLAIELVAGLHFLAPEELYAGLESRLRLLAHGSRDLPFRHRTMRDALDESHARLTPAERVVFRRLAIFHDGWTHEAAEAVCDPFASQERLPLAVPIILRALLDKSLVCADGESGPGLRFSMLGIIREYAAEQLAASGERAVVRDWHADYYVGAAAAVAARLEAGDSAAFASFLSDEDNFRDALLRLIAVGDHERVAWAARLLPWP